jgi:hypothetical protein
MLDYASSLVAIRKSTIPGGGGVAALSQELTASDVRQTFDILRKERNSSRNAGSITVAEVIKCIEDTGITLSDEERKAIAGQFASEEISPETLSEIANEHHRPESPTGPAAKLVEVVSSGKSVRISSVGTEMLAKKKVCILSAMFANLLQSDPVCVRAANETQQRKCLEICTHSVKQQAFTSAGSGVLSVVQRRALSLYINSYYHDGAKEQYCYAHTEEGQSADLCTQRGSASRTEYRCDCVREIGIHEG